MKIILITGEGYEHYYVANQIAALCPLSSIIVDRGWQVSRIKKIFKIYKRYSVIELISKAIGKIFSFIWRDNYNYKKEMFRILGSEKCKRFFRKDLITYVNGINTKESIDLIKHLRPDIILIYGTSIIGKEVIQIPSRIILNMHTGISPYYRGAGCSFWPIFNNELDKLGATIHETTSDVDGGQIFRTGRIQLSTDDNLHSVFAKCVQIGAEIYISVVKQMISQAIKGEKQNFAQGNEYKAGMKNWHHVYSVRKKITKGLIRDYVNQGK